MMQRFSTAALVCASILAPAIAVAAPQTADDWFKEGNVQYNLGSFDKAVDAFKAAYELDQKPAYLYNIAQSYRQAGDCKNSLFFYKRFLAIKANDTVKPLKPELKAEIEKRMVELDACVAQQNSLKSKPPELTEGGSGSGGTTTTTPTTGTTTTAPPEHTKPPTKTGSNEQGDDDDDRGGVSASANGEQPKVITARIVGGVAKVSAGDLTTPLRFTGTLIGGYPLALSPEFTLELGAGLSYQPAQYQNAMGTSESSSFVSWFANVGAVYNVAPKIGVRLDVGAGALTLSGLSMGNPYTQNGVAATGAISMFAFRAGISADYAFTPNVFGTVAPIAFSYSPAKSGFRDGISSIDRFDIMLGVGYRM